MPDKPTHEAAELPEDGGALRKAVEEQCNIFGLPTDFHMLIRHMENNWSLAEDNWKATMASLRERMQLSETLLEHLSEVMNGEINQPHPKDGCIWCREIREEIQRVLATLDQEGESD